MVKIERKKTNQFDFDLCKVIIDSDFKELVILQDLHVGSPNFKQHSFEKLVEYTFLNNCLWAYNGDGVDNATRNSVASPYESTMKPNDQLNYLVKSFDCIKQNCIGFVSGNHENRTKKDSDFDFTQELAERLNSEYYGNELYFIISCPKDQSSVGYGCYMNHSDSSNKNPGLDSALMQRDWMQWNENIDIFFRGHTHQAHFTTAAAAVLDFQNVCVKQKNRWLINAGSFLSRPKSYASKKPYALNSNVYYSAKLSFLRGKKQVEPIIHYT